MGHHRNMLLSSYEGSNKASNSDHRNNISLVSPKEKFVCHAQVIVSSRYQRRKLGLDISRIFIDYDSNVIDQHRNALLSDEERNKASSPDLDMDSRLMLELISEIITY